MCRLSVSNVIYHKFSHGAAFYMLNGKNVRIKNIVWTYFLNLAHLYECTGAPVAQWFKRWPTDLAD